MISLKAVAIGAALFLASSASAAADEMEPATVGGFSRECQPIRALQRGEEVPAGKDIKVAFCFGFIAGAAEERGDYAIYCAPPLSNAQQRALIFLKWADENPELHDIPRAMGLTMALTKAFPCPAKVK